MPRGVSPRQSEVDASVVHLFIMDNEVPFILVDANRAREETEQLFGTVSKLLVVGRLLAPRTVDAIDPPLPIGVKFCCAAHAVPRPGDM
jgi:hypothetical protein